MHHFGSEVRRAREAADLTQTELGDLVPCDKSSVSRIESGLIAPDEAFARACDTAFPQMGGWFTRFWKDSRTWGAAFPAAFREFATYEAAAIALWTFQHTLMPGLLQTEDYARAVLGRHPDTTPEQAAERVTARMARQSVLDRDNPPRFWVLLDESVLHREIGDEKIMRDQLSHLAEMARRPNITVQLLSRSGAHVGLQGAFVMAETPDALVVNLEHFADGMTTDSPATVAIVNERLDTLRTEAFRGSESLARIEEMAEKWTP